MPCKINKTITESDSIQSLKYSFLWLKSVLAFPMVFATGFWFVCFVVVVVVVVLAVQASHSFHVDS